MSSLGEALSGTPAGSAAIIAGPGDRPRVGRFAVYARALVGDKLTLAAVVFLAILAVTAVFAPVVAPYPPNAQSLFMRNHPPFSKPEEGWFPHIIGTDFLGRDQLSRLIYGGRISLAVGLTSVLISGLLGTLLGLLAGYYRGLTDDVIMRLVDVQMAFPSLLLALFVLYAVGSSVVNVVFVLAITRWMVYARVTRALVLSYRENVFIEAARATGCTDRRIIFAHLVPNLLSPVIVLATLEVATVILVETALSFLGLGLQPPNSSWGLMLTQGRQYITSAWWLVTFPGLAILLTALSLNLLATWVRAISDPAQRWRYFRAASG